MFKRLEGIFGAPEKLEDLDYRVTGIMDALKTRKESFNCHIQHNIKAHIELRKRLDDLEARMAALDAAPLQDKHNTASDAPDDSAEVDYIKLSGKSINLFMDLIERSYISNNLVNSQRRFTNRLLRLLRTTVEDPGKSITEDLRKAEKWNKVLRKRVRSFSEKDDKGAVVDINMKGK